MYSVWDFMVVGLPQRISRDAQDAGDKEKRQERIAGVNADKHRQKILES